MEDGQNEEVRWGFLVLALRKSYALLCSRGILRYGHQTWASRYSMSVVYLQHFTSCWIVDRFEIFSQCTFIFELGCSNTCFFLGMQSDAEVFVSSF